VISDLRMDELDGIGLLKELQSRWPGLKVILLTAHGTIPDAVQATQMGAFGFLTKPVEKQELLDQVQKALKISGFVDTDQDWRADFVTRSPLMEEKLAQAHMVAGTDARVLITGESGTGKELLARAIHKASPRRNRPFVSIDCSAMDENTLESELFGHVKGAFSGATSEHRGLFQNAEGSTLLLGEIGDMPMRLQVQLLRVLQENLIRPMGSNQAIATNVRLISSTHSDLQRLIAGGQFREDLYYRLNIVHIEMPSLNRRREDIAVLVAHFLAGITRDSGSHKIYAPGSGGAARDQRLAGQRAPAAECGAPERRAVADTDHSGGTGAAVAGWHARQQAALVRRGARGIHAQLPVADSADHQRQRQPGGAARQAQSHRFLQAARPPPAGARRLQGQVACGKPRPPHPPSAISRRTPRSDRPRTRSARGSSSEKIGSASTSRAAVTALGKSSAP
jgi:hypothetical protein